jgi:hypothetical protein
MPTIKLGPLGILKLTRTRQHTAHLSESTTRNESCELDAKTREAPRPYSDCNPSTTSAVDEKAIEEEDRSLHTPIAQKPPDARPVSCRAEQLRLYIFEILAITVDANFYLLNDALGNIPSPDYNATSSLLSHEERIRLRELANLVHRDCCRTGPGQMEMSLTIFDHVFEPARKSSYLFLEHFSPWNLSDGTAMSFPTTPSLGAPHFPLCGLKMTPADH